MDDLAAFIAARLDEDEAEARVLGGSEWDAQHFRDGDWAIRGTGMGPRAIADAWKPETARHVARHDPARVLREVAAKRAIVAEHQPRRVGQSLTWCGRCHRVIRDAREDEDPCGPFDWPCPTMRALAAIWSDHGDYRAEWAPGHG